MKLISNAMLTALLVLMAVFAANSATSNNKRIAIVVEYVGSQGKEDKVSAMLKDHAKLTIKEEPGCLRFEILKPVSKDGSRIRNHIMVTELYADQEAARIHAKKALAKLLSTIRPMLISEKITYSIV